MVDDFGTVVFYWDAFPSVNLAMIRWYSAALATMGSILQLASGKLGIQNGISSATLTLDNGTGGTLTTLLPDAWYRLDFWHHAEATANGQIRCRLYDAGSTFLEEFTTAPDPTMPAAATARIDVGITSANASQPVSSSDFLRLGLIVDDQGFWTPPPRTLEVVEFPKFIHSGRMPVA